jgi:HEAT repeat protein
MKQPDREQRFRAIEALSQAGPDAAPAIPDLLKLLSTPRFGSAAAIALGCIGADAVELLVPLLEHRDVWTRVCVLDALGMIGYPAGKAVPKIIFCLEDRETRFSAVTALSGIGEPAIPSLKVLTTSDKAMLREMAISALANAGPTALPYLRKAVRDEDLMVRLVAILALEDMGPAAKPAAPDLVSVLGDENQTIRRLARQALDSVQRPSLREMEERTARLAALEAAEAAREKEKPKLPIEPSVTKKRETQAPEPGRAIAD